MARGIAMFEQRGAEERARCAKPQTSNPQRSRSRVRRRELVVEHVAHVVAKAHTKVSREYGNQAREDAIRQESPRHHVATRRVSARTDGERTSACSRCNSAVNTRPPSAVIL